MTVTPGIGVPSTATWPLMLAWRNRAPANDTPLCACPTDRFTDCATVGKLYALSSGFVIVTV